MTIKLSAEAQAAIKLHPSDEKLIKILNEGGESFEASHRMQRWMAAQILGTLGYKFEV